MIEFYLSRLCCIFTRSVEQDKKPKDRLTGNRFLTKIEKQFSGGRKVYNKCFWSNWTATGKNMNLNLTSLLTQI